MSRKARWSRTRPYKAMTSVTLRNTGVRDQIARYKAARRITSIDGAALHFFAYVARTDQQIAIVMRRRGSRLQGLDGI